MAIQSAPRLLFIALNLALMLIAVPVHGTSPLTIDATRQYDYAQSRLDADAPDEAIVEFNRFIHFFPDDPRVPRARFQTGIAHFGTGRFQEAAAVFKQLTAGFSVTALSIEAYFMLSRSHARKGMTEQAMVDLHNLMALSPAADVRDRARYEMGWLHVDQGRWNDADQTFGLITPGNQDRFGVTNLRQALARSDTIPVKNPATAGLLSIVPGAGQLYCNRYQDAAVALLVNAGLIWTAWEAFDNDQIALGSVVSFVAFGFYAGNIYSAVSSAYKYNRDRIVDFREGLNPHRQVALSLTPAHKGARLCLTIDF